MTAVNEFSDFRVLFFQRYLNIFEKNSIKKRFWENLSSVILERAEVICGLPLSEYHENLSKSPPKPFSCLTLSELEEVKKCRKEAEAAFFEHIVTQVPLENGSLGIRSISDLHQVVLEAEGDYIDYDPRSSAYFHRVDNLGPWNITNLILACF